MYVLPATTPVIVLYSFWKLHVAMVTVVAPVGAATEPYAVVFVHSDGGGGPHEVQAMVVTQQLLAVPQAALVFQCR